jgi:amino acid transporter
MTDAPDAPDSPRSSLDGEDIVIEDEDPLVGGQAQKATKLNVLDGIALVIGLQIGSGIFSAPSQVSSNVISPGEGILVWIFSGLLAWTGAASFIELGLAIPRNGGIQEYLQYCYGDFAGFLFTWTWTIIVKPAANAVIATVLGDYLSSTMSPSNQPITIISKVLGTLFIVIITFINCLGARTSRNVATGFLVFKLILAFSIISIGISFCFKSGEGVPSSGLGWFGVTNPSTVSIWARLGNIVTAMLGALFCYGGWESVRVSNWKSCEQTLLTIS